MRNPEKVRNLRFLRAVRVDTAGGAKWIAAVFQRPGGVIEAVYRVCDGSLEFVAAYAGSGEYWNVTHEFWGRVVVLAVRPAAPVRGLTIPAAAIPASGS